MPGDVSLSYQMLSNPDRIRLDIEILGMPKYVMFELYNQFTAKYFLEGKTIQDILVIGGECAAPTLNLNAQQVYEQMWQSQVDGKTYNEFIANQDSIVKQYFGVDTAIEFGKQQILGMYNNSEFWYFGSLLSYAREILPDLENKSEEQIIADMRGYFNNEYTFEEILDGVTNYLLGGSQTSLDDGVIAINAMFGIEEERGYIFSREQILHVVAATAYALAHPISVECSEIGVYESIDWFKDTDMKFSKYYTMTDATEYNFSVKGISGNTKELIVKISSITLDKTEIVKANIVTETTETITATVENIDGELTWESSNPEVAQISGEGNTRTITIKPVDGEATITVSCGEFKAECKVIVTEGDHSEAVVPTIEATGNFANNAKIKEVRQGNIPVPKDFTYIKGDAKGGAVVQAPDGSEFVWVPVENAIYSSTHENVSKIPISLTNGSKKGYDYTPMGIEVDGEYKGLLYDFNSTGGAYLMYPSAEKYQGTTSGYREPDSLVKVTTGTTATEGIKLLKSIVGLTGTGEEILSKWQDQMQIEYKEMIESVEKYGGFYVGRYETSLKEVTKEEGTKEKVAQVKSGIQAATAKEDSANTWYGFYQRQKEYSMKNSLTNIVGSSMIWGSQYDQMMIWMQKNDIDVTGEIGNDRNLGTTADNGATSVGTTGTTPTDKINNIYDLYGNGFEWTLEAKENAYIDYRVFYGRCYRKLERIS